MSKSENWNPRLLAPALVIAFAGLQGCALFVSHYDATAYQYVTSLKAFHVKFLEDNKAGNGKSFDEVRVKNACDVGELRFREASEYANGKNDTTRVNAITYVHNVFRHNCKITLESKKMFGSDFADQQIDEINKNYDWAIKGEIYRIGAPSK